MWVQHLGDATLIYLSWCQELFRKNSGSASKPPSARSKPLTPAPSTHVQPKLAPPFVPWERLNRSSFVVVATIGSTCRRRQGILRRSNVVPQHRPKTQADAAADCHCQLHPSVASGSVTPLYFDARCDKNGRDTRDIRMLNTHVSRIDSVKHATTAGEKKNYHSGW